MMIETFILKGYKTIFQGDATDWQTNVNFKEIEFARREFNEFPTDEEIDEFRKEFNPTRCEVAKNYR